MKLLLPQKLIVFAKKLSVGGGGGGDGFEELPSVAATVHKPASGLGPIPTTRGPTPSKLAVLLFYLSCIFCVLGAIMITHSIFYAHEEDRSKVLCTGSAISLAGVILAFVMNVMNNRENARFVAYVQAKAEEMKDDYNSRQRFNREYAIHLGGSDGPNGVH